MPPPPPITRWSAAPSPTSDHWRDQPEIETIADAAGVTPTELHHLFRRWAGLTPKAFLQALTLDGARQLLRDSASVLDAAYEVGLSGPGRLHDLFVTHEAMSPGEWKSGGEGLTVPIGFHPSPFGTALVIATERGLAGLAFADTGEEDAALDDMRRRWPRASNSRDDARTAPLAHRIFDPRQWQRERPLRVVIIGTDFEVRVWETLLKVPMGSATTYSDIAAKVCTPERRAPSAPPSARTRSRSWCRATASSARTATSPAITGASPASAPCSAGKPGKAAPWRRPVRLPPRGDGGMYGNCTRGSETPRGPPHRETALATCGERPY